MTLVKTLSAAVLCTGLAFSTSSCSHEPKDSKEVAEEMNDSKFNKEGEKEADKLVDAYSSNLYEIRASESAAMNASTPEVKKLAGMMVEAHTKMNEDVKTLAASKQVTLPTDLTEDQRKDIDKLSEKKGMDYDKAYTDNMKNKHEDALSMLEKTADKCDDPEIKTWASNTVPEVRSHLDMVKSTCAMLKDKK